MARAFGGETGMYLVLLDQDGQHFLWPEVVAVPEGWNTIHSFDNWQHGVAYIRGLSLRRFQVH
jgi:uncharacterized protein YbdZ (MbtH family)